jgi:hypothetical protein
MRIIQKLVAAASLTMVGVAGFGLAAAGSASAAAGDSTLTCTTGTSGFGFPDMTCTATDPDGVHSIHVVAKQSGGVRVGAAAAPCAPTPSNSLTDVFSNLQLVYGSPNNPYIVTVADCAGNKDIYRVDATTGAVTFLRSVSV